MNKLIQIIEDDARKICQKVDLSEIKDKSILITGASGLMGHYYSACLKVSLAGNQSKAQVYCVAQRPPDYWYEFLDYPGAEVLFGDLTDHDFCQSLPEVDYIIHAAGYGQPGKFLSDPVRTLKLNSFTTFCLLEKLKLHGKFLFISSSEVYSGLANPPHKESEIGTTNTDHVRACYIEAKRCGEAICNAYRRRGVNAKSARVSLGFGPGTRPSDTRVLHSFIYRALKEGKIELMDSGQARRTYCYIADAVEMLWQILLNGKSAIYNVGGEAKTSIAELAQFIGEYLQVPVIFPKTLHAVEGAPLDVSLDLTKVKTEFGKTEFLPLAQALAITIEWQKALFEREQIKH